MTPKFEKTRSIAGWHKHKLADNFTQSSIDCTTPIHQPLGLVLWIVDLQHCQRHKRIIRHELMKLSKSETITLGCWSFGSLLWCIAKGWTFLSVTFQSQNSVTNITLTLLIFSSSLVITNIIKVPCGLFWFPHVVVNCGTL